MSVFEMTHVVTKNGPNNLVVFFIVCVASRMDAKHCLFRSISVGREHQVPSAIHLSHRCQAIHF